MTESRRVATNQIAPSPEIAQILPAEHDAEQARPPLAEEHHRQAGDDLIDAQVNDGRGKQHRCRGRDDHGDENSNDRIATHYQDAGNAGQGTHQHDAFGSQVEHAGALADDQAESGQCIGRSITRSIGKPMDEEVIHGQRTR